MDLICCVTREARYEQDTNYWTAKGHASLANQKLYRPLCLSSHAPVDCAGGNEHSGTAGARVRSLLECLATHRSSRDVPNLLASAE